MSEVVVELITLGGGFAGYASIAYLLWKKFKKNIRVYGISGTYEVEKAKSEGFYNVTATIEVGFLNDSDETIAITDIGGSLKYNKELYDKMLASSVNIPRIPEVYFGRPKNFYEVANFSIQPHGAVKKSIIIVFPNMIIDLIDRIGFAHFVGFLNGKIPFFQVDERELKENWSVHPLVLLLSVHVDGRKIQNIQVSLFKKSEAEMSGTLNIVDIEKIKKNFREGRH